MVFNKQVKFLRIIIIVFLFFQTLFIYAQEDAFTNEINYQGEKVYFNNKPLTGWLFSEQDGIPNACDCILKAKYKNGLLNGLEKKWYSNGKQKQVSKYLNGVILSKTFYFSNGKVRKKETYSNSAVVASTLYNKDGTKKGNNPSINTTVATSINPESSNNRSVIYTTASTTNTNPINTTSYSMSQQGLQKRYYPNGKIKRIKFHKNGLLVKDSLFYENSNLHITKKYEDGELVHSEEYLQNKKLLKEQNFKNNKKSGIQRENFDSGNPKYIEKYDNGELTHREIYNEEGFLLNEENYKFGKKNGQQKQFDEQGKLLLLKEYSAGVLVKKERITEQGKEIATFEHNIAKIKLFNSQNKLLELKFVNDKNNQKDSIWIKFNPNTGFKIEETAYVEGYKTRHGKYQNNKRQGVWHFYWQNKKGETLKWYENENLIKTKKYTYSKQLKNNFKEGDLIFNYKTSTLETGNNYFLLRNISKTEAHIKLVKEAITRAFINQFIPINTISEIKDEELYELVTIKTIDFKFKPKKEGSRKVVAYISTTIESYSFKTKTSVKNSITFSPVNKEHKKINTLYTKDKSEAFKETLQNFKQYFKESLQKTYPLVGFYIKATQQNSKEISEVLVYFEKANNIFEKDILVITDAKNSIKATLKVHKINNHNVICKIKEGGSWLKRQQQSKVKIIVKKKNTLNEK